MAVFFEDPEDPTFQAVVQGGEVDAFARIVGHVRQTRVKPREVTRCSCVYVPIFQGKNMPRPFSERPNHGRSGVA